MFESNKKSGEKPIKIFLKTSKKITNYKEDEKTIKEDNNQ